MSTRRRHRRSCNDPGDAHELTCSCYQRLQLLKSDRTCGWLCEAIDAARRQLNFAVWAYVFMPEHVHLLVWPRNAQYEMSDILTAIKHPVSKRAFAYLRRNAPDWIPRLTRRRGQRRERCFWQSGGGYDRNIKSGKTLLSMIDYLHLNPVRRGLAKRPEEWKWSSAAWFLDGRGSPLRLDKIPADWLVDS